MRVRARVHTHTHTKSQAWAWDSNPLPRKHRVHLGRDQQPGSQGEAGAERVLLSPREMPLNGRGWPYSASLTTGLPETCSGRNVSEHISAWPLPELESADCPSLFSGFSLFLG